MRVHWSQVLAILFVLSLLAGCVAPPVTQPSPAQPAPQALAPATQPPSTQVPPTQASTATPSATTPALQPPTQPAPATPTIAVQPAPSPQAAAGKAPSALEEALAGKYKGKRVVLGSHYGGSWETDYLDSFKDFEQKTGITINYLNVDAESQIFRQELDAGVGPDVVDFTWAGPVAGFAKEGKVIDVGRFLDKDALRSRYEQNWLDWATMDGPSGPIMGGLWNNVRVDSLVYYPKAAFDKAGYKVPATWQELLALSDQIVKDGGTPWCIENGNVMQGPGTSAVIWIDDIMLRTVPPADYYKWIKGELPFDSPQVKHAVQLMSDLWFKPGYAQGRRENLNTTYAYQVGALMFSTPPKCWLLKEPDWLTWWDGHDETTAFTGKEYGTDYAFFLLPPIEAAYGAPVQVESDIYAMFRDRPEVRALMEYLSTGALIEGLVKKDYHDGFSPHKGASLDWYVKPQERAAAEIAQAAQKAGNLQYDAGDAMTLAVNTEFYKSISDYVVGKIDLDTALKQIDAARAGPAASATP